MSVLRRELLALLAAPSAAWAADCADVPGQPYLPPCQPWPQGIEGQRKADMGDGRFLNPVLAGDRPDPSVLKDGDDYYLTHSSFEAVPGLLIWHSRDLVNWRPLVNALHEAIGSVWAPDLCKHGGRYYLYLPVKATPNDILVIWADRIEGPWSKPVALGLHKHIDPTHVAGEDGQRWLFLSGGDRVKLSADGLKLAGPIEHVYDPWRYPDDWDVEIFSPEGPKMLRHGGWWHMLLAVGGTAGPPTGHMVIAARSRTLDGPWSQAPHNPLMRTKSPRERWWSRGHGSLVQGPRGAMKPRQRIRHAQRPHLGLTHRQGLGQNLTADQNQQQRRHHREGLHPATAQRDPEAHRNHARVRQRVAEHQRRQQILRRSEQLGRHHARAARLRQPPSLPFA